MESVSDFFPDFEAERDEEKPLSKSAKQVLKNIKK